MAESEPDWEADFAAFERLVGLSLPKAQREKVLDRLKTNRKKFTQLRDTPLDFGAEPTTFFRPVDPPEGSSSFWLSEQAVDRPAEPDGLAFLSAAEHSRLIAAREVSPVELARLYLDRLSNYGPKLKALVTLTEDLALQQASAAEDRQMRDARLGPLDGVPWGAKDLLATRGYRTTWGASPFKDQEIDIDATVVEKLEAAGAVLVGKLSLGALASGPNWFGGSTRNPWNLEQDSSGSSAGPGAATAAGLVGFSIGSETQGSITSPSNQCGVTGLRPTYGRVSRYGAMALSWTMDKLGPMCRSVEDCAAVFDAIRGEDSRDPSSVDAPFAWPPSSELEGVRIGMAVDSYDGIEEEPLKKVHEQVRETLVDLGAEIGEWTAPDLPASAIEILLSAEASASFDSLLADDKAISDLVETDKSNWPASFIAARAIPAVEYLRALRSRRPLIDAWEASLVPFDVILSPGNGSRNLSGANLTGHPALTLKCGFLEEQPVSMTFVGHLHDESGLLAAGFAYESATDWHKRHPSVDA
ncbi:MAG: amidase [Gemmatimonadetes bacterium]|nr:amidase [Gemmatimonadota bacterium]